MVLDFKDDIQKIIKQIFTTKEEQKGILYTILDNSLVDPKNVIVEPVSYEADSFTLKIKDGGQLIGDINRTSAIVVEDWMKLLIPTSDQFLIIKFRNLFY